MPTGEDAAFERGILKNDVEPLLHRVQAGIAAYLILCLTGDLSAAVKSRRRAADRCTGELLDHALAHLTENCVLETHPDCACDGIVIAINFHVPFGPLVTGSAVHLHRVHDYILERALLIHGTTCDSCGASPADGSIRLKHCGRCEWAYFCSSACQKGAWELHRRACRPRGVFVADDLVRIAGVKSVDRQELKSRVVEVQGPVPDRPGRWAVAHIGAEPGQDMSIHGDKLFLVMTTDELKELLQGLVVDFGGGKTCDGA
ncbi:hypothetical protein BDK51DRAFT_43130 [Blyttiomyces helicus]|uniref:MYND-type domain-containing protein n=1 Tax=Blyttiomyces helicus TaxID=388810 RepID=A0A4P9WJE3_9FUNG|nr:hypothetical protein BDK51DRAFT_43130 [Blyttiomyces helicus]|eukprot:RKO93041.1 hypothetical protein BDK51DRAFT_43130 [Blyttiomyces helicus]